MKHVIKLTSMVLGAMLVHTLALAQTAGKAGRMYDPATETTTKGIVQTTTETAGGQMMGVHLTVKTGDEVQDVMLGPARFLASQKFAFAKGDSVEVTGSKITMEGKAYIVAREVVKDGKTLILRDKNGVPSWAAGGKMRGGPSK